MNWLAHLFLSKPTVEDRLGNLLADLVKGTDRQKLSSRFNSGIQSHLAIDRFTDRHLIVKQSKARINPDYKRYSGVLVDIFYDHILARNWQKYSSVSLSEFTEEIYISFQNNLNELPLATSQRIEQMINRKLLDSYYDISGIERTLTRIKKRLSNKHTDLFIVSDALKQLEDNYIYFEADFNIFFPEIIDFLQQEKYR